MSTHNICFVENQRIFELTPLLSRAMLAMEYSPNGNGEYFGY